MDGTCYTMDGTCYTMDGTCYTMDVDIGLNYCPECKEYMLCSSHVLNRRCHCVKCP